MPDIYKLTQKILTLLEEEGMERKDIAIFLLSVSVNAFYALRCSEEEIMKTFSDILALNIRNRTS